jgi:hypothetical protein
MSKWKVGDIDEPWGKECGRWQVESVNLGTGVVTWKPASPEDLALATARYRLEMAQNFAA